MGKPNVAESKAVAFRLYFELFLMGFQVKLKKLIGGLVNQVHSLHPSSNTPTKPIFTATYRTSTSSSKKLPSIF
jgi:hypothetical protein